MKKIVKHVVFVLVVALVAFAGMTLMHNMRRTSEISKASFASERYGRTRHEKIKGYSEWCRGIMQRDDFNDLIAEPMMNNDGSLKAYAFVKEENGKQNLIAFMRYDQFVYWMNTVDDKVYYDYHTVLDPVAEWMHIL